MSKKLLRVYFLLAIMVCLIGTAAVQAASVLPSLVLDKQEISIDVGDSENLSITLTPVEAAEAGFDWTSSDPSIAVFEAGKIKGLKEGTATLTFTSKLDASALDSCEVTVQNKPEPELTLTLPETITVQRGSTGNIYADISPSSFANSGVEWTITSNPSNSILINYMGLGCTITAMKPGTATIRATSLKDRSKFRECVVTVPGIVEPPIESPGDDDSDGNDDPGTTDPGDNNGGTTDPGGNNGGTTDPGPTPNPTVSVTGIILNKNQLNLLAGASETLTQTVSPADATNKTVSWQSDNTTVATVDANGQVTAVNAGTATITVTTTDGAFKANCTVTVTAETVSVTGVSLAESQVSLNKFARKTLVANITPADATNKRVRWASSNPQKVYVNSEGQVSGVSEGSATITVTTEDGGFTATCRVSVSETDTSVPVTGVSFTPTSLQLSSKQTQKLYCVITPRNATNKSVSLSSNNTSVATVDSSGLVTAVAPGTATITVTTASGGRTARCVVTVTGTSTTTPTTPAPGPGVIGTARVSGISLDETNISLPVGSSQILYHTISPSNAANTHVTWSSSNPGVATVDNNGQVTGLAPGSARLTVKTTDGGFTAFCNAVVTAKKTGITVELNGQELSFDVPPRIINNRTMVPLRGIFEALGATVTWDGATKTVTATRGENTIKLQIGSYNAYKNGTLIKLDSPPQLISNRTLVPIRFIAESLGCTVDWDGESQTVIINDTIIDGTTDNTTNENTTN